MNPTLSGGRGAVEEFKGVGVAYTMRFLGLSIGGVMEGQKLRLMTPSRSRRKGWLRSPANYAREPK